MKKIKNSMAGIILLITAISLAPSCKKNSEKVDYNSNKSTLSAKIDSLTAVYSVAVEGKQAGDYSPGAKEALKTALTLAANVKTGTYTQRQVDNALANLDRAGVQFSVNLIQQISADNLIASWTFNGDAKDVSGHGNDGLLKTGWLGTPAKDGNTLPVLTTDRYGVANSAYDFKNAAYIEVPYQPALRPSSFTICAWIKPTEASNGNYIFSLNRWNGYKFQLQGNNLPFLTVTTTTGIFDKDDGGASVPLNKWSQVVVSFVSGVEKFYINGALVGTQNITGDPTTLTSPPPIAIGNEMPKSAYNLTDSNAPNAYYGANFFIGSIDDLHLYNKALSENEVKSLYTMEQP